ncbi:uncharacterized protein B0H18DRAFT_1026487 [Fomitopsis serialis]|uniref:uncharacterized protein n=1 Tax=Fomitopsis serialis TaxID=139415 RepID=UPI002008D335|nr:uncharacterized protein B0H18DRAFT_1026487 [Neoantrodia serialis]KAH9919857.1 hypothetical protein B0H18DRAFT_1026487 [Neoantrodia serialis]
MTRAELPAELILLIHAAASDKKAAVELLCISKAAHLWVLPVLLRTVVLTTRRQVNAFARALRSPQRTVAVDTPSDQKLGSYVQHLWIGPNDSSSANPLQSSIVSVWPIDNIRAILPHCTSLKALAVANFPEELWPRMGPLLPFSLESIHLGSVCAYMHWNWTEMPCYPTLRSITSMELGSVWSLRMYKAVATLPNIRTLRRFFPPILRNTHRTALQRAAALEPAATMERMEIIQCKFHMYEVTPICLDLSSRFVFLTVDDWLDRLYRSERAMNGELHESDWHC